MPKKISKACWGCEYLKILTPEDDYCCMFRDKPKGPFCAQHTKYKKARERNGKVLGRAIKKLLS
jgi:hypothetical protein